MRVIAERFCDFAYTCQHRNNNMCHYTEKKKHDKCSPKTCPLLDLPLRGEPQDAVVKRCPITYERGPKEAS